MPYSRAIFPGRTETVAYESLWVRSNLGTYCAPGDHEFLMADGPKGGVRWCAKCLKEEPTDGSGCLVCDLPGYQRVELVNVRDEEQHVVGMLCSTCSAGFDERSVIGGWARLPRQARLKRTTATAEGKQGTP